MRWWSRFDISLGPELHILSAVHSFVLLANKGLHAAGLDTISPALRAQAQAVSRENAPGGPTILQSHACAAVIVRYGSWSGSQQWVLTLGFEGVQPRLLGLEGRSS